MKTKEQIIAWLDKQPWKGEFCENHLKYERTPIKYDDEFISSSFVWPKTKQGGEYWSRIEDEYLKWYASTNKPMSWKEYCERTPIKDGDYFINSWGCVIPMNVHGKRISDDSDANVMPKEYCKAFVAYMKLIQLRNAWIKDEDSSPCVHKILLLGDSVKVVTYPDDVKGLSFSSFETAYNFICTFKDLLEEAKPLL